MKNIWAIFKGDVNRIRKNVIAMIVIIGVTVVPCLYAWFNIAASWNPYENTGELKVAVASVDEGYEGDLISVNLNLGDQIISTLHENTQLNWVFTSKKKAMNGVKSGKYYAAIVIPKDFSKNMMSVFTEEVQKPQIMYYSNAKENAIAPKVTDKGATAIQTQVNEVFVKTISDVALTAFSTVANTVDKTGTETITSNLITNLSRITSDLSASASTLQTFSSMVESAQKLLGTTAEYLGQSKTQSKQSLSSIKTTKSSLSGVKKTISGATDGINKALAAGSSFYEDVSNIVDKAFQSQAKDADKVADTIETLSEKIENVADSYNSLSSNIAVIGTDHPEVSSFTEEVVAKLNESVAIQKELSESLLTNADELRNASEDIQSSQEDIDSLLKDSKKSLSTVQSTYEDDLKDSLDNLSSSLGSTGTDINGLLKKLDTGTDKISATADTAAEELSDIKTALDTSCSLLNRSAKQIKSLTKKLTNLQENGDVSELKSLLTDNTDDISTFLSAPVSLNTKKLYPIENYGSSMAPFYSTLSIWVGGIVLVAMLKVSVSEASIEGLKKVKNYQMYLGRYIIFLIVGLLQSTLICLGDLFYLGIQCKHPFLFMLAGWFSSIVYVNIIYTLTVSFGDIGKAASVILLVIQVAGSGGTFPIEVAPAFFRAVYPLLPFVHSMRAFRETIGGMYGMTYWTSLGKMSIFLILSLILGLLLRKPIIKLNDAFMEKLEDTHLI
nr:YhgE/Pip domain-containing protein [uncultured Anaerobutyricum sp.]